MRLPADTGNLIHCRDRDSRASKARGHWSPTALPLFHQITTDEADQMLARLCHEEQIELIRLHDKNAWPIGC
jgi:hypothetical protein